MKVIELINVLDNDYLAEPERTQEVAIMDVATFVGSGGYWQGTVEDFVSAYNRGLYQTLGNSEVVKFVIQGYSSYELDGMEITIPLIVFD